MNPPTNGQEQQHPQERQDRLIIDRLFQQEADEFSLCELARLRIRYHNFPGAELIKRDLDLLLGKWQLSEEQLYEQTRAIYALGKLNRLKSSEEEQDWS